MKRKIYTFKVGNDVHKVHAESMGAAMAWMNRQVMDKLNKGPWAWMEAGPVNTFYATGGY